MISLLVFIVVCVAAAAPGMIFRPGAWYAGLAKPAWCPPNWLFGPVWAVLYLSIAVSGWLVWQQRDAIDVTGALAIYGVHLLFNAIWSVVFFGWRRPDWALLEILCLFVSIVATMVAFHRVEAVAAYLLVPYAAWAAFAAVLNFGLWRLNPGTASARSV